MFLHVTFASSDEQVEALKKKFDNQYKKLDNSIIKMNQELEVKNNEFCQLKVKFDTLERLVDEKHISDLKNDIKDKDAKINSLEMRLEELETDHHTHKQQQDKKMKEIGNTCKQTKKKESENQSITSLENQIKTLETTYSEDFKEIKSRLFETVPNLEAERQKRIQTLKVKLAILHT